MKAYSVDFRKKIIDVYQRENISIRKLAQRFLVTTSFVQKLIKQYQETGNLEPQKRGGNKPKKLNPEHIEILKKIIVENQNYTLKKLSQLFGEKTGIKVSQTTIFKLLKEIEITR